MNNRILVHAVLEDGCIRLRTVSRARKSPHWFYVPAEKIMRLEWQESVIVSDIRSFASIRLDAYNRIVDIAFTWLRGDVGDEVSGYLERVSLPYGELYAFANGEYPSCDGCADWKAVGWRIKFIYYRRFTAN